MKNLAINQLAKVINAQAVEVIEGDINGVSIDSRTIKPGQCFFAVKGANFDGHDYIKDAFKAAAACAVVSKDLSGKKLLRVDDTIKALGLLAKEYRKNNDFKVIAITGSVGKTTVRHITAHVLSGFYKLIQSPKNFNNSLGLPLTLLSAEPQDEVIIAELGTNYPGEIEYLCDIAAPDIALVTNIRPAHLVSFKNLEAIRKEKLSIASGLRPDGIFITEPYLDIKPQNITFQQSSSRFTIESTEIQLPLPGPGNIENTVSAWSICKRLNISISDFAEKLKTLPPICMRAEIIKAGSVTIINDSYNANPTSMQNALEILKNFTSTQKGRSVFICADMAELGEKSQTLHEQLGLEIANAGVELLITIGKFSRAAAHAANSASKDILRTHSFSDTISACNNLDKFVKQNDIVLVKGSRTAGLELAVKKLIELNI